MNHSPTNSDDVGLAESPIAGNGRDISFPGKPGDGPISICINRRISCPISRRIVARVSPNQATMLALVIGTCSMLLFAVNSWIAGGIFLQLSSILSGVDGEIARLRGRCSDWGDFLDTVADRLVEYFAILGITFGLYQTLGISSIWSGMLFLGSTFLLTTASEKFRSTTGENYPKRQFDHYFAWISAGRDARLFVLAAGSFFATFSPAILLGIIIALTVIGHINLLYRISSIRYNLRFN